MLAFVAHQFQVIRSAACRSHSANALHIFTHPHPTFHSHNCVIMFSVNDCSYLLVYIIPLTGIYCIAAAFIGAEVGCSYLLYHNYDVIQCYKLLCSIIKMEQLFTQTWVVYYIYIIKLFEFCTFVHAVMRACNVTFKHNLIAIFETETF